MGHTVISPTSGASLNQGRCLAIPAHPFELDTQTKHKGRREHMRLASFQVYNWSGTLPACSKQGSSAAKALMSAGLC